MAANKDMQTFKDVRPRQARRRGSEWRNAIGEVCVFAAIFCLATAASVLVFSGPAPPGAKKAASNAGAEHTGTIVLHNGFADEQCQQAKFDNDNGRFIEHFAPCDNSVVLDSHSVPLALGTIHRLDAISKSFVKP